MSRSKLISEAEYKAALKLMEYLMDHGTSQEMLDLAAMIEVYEEVHYGW